jgi:hypothetical protein
MGGCSSDVISPPEPTKLCVDGGEEGVVTSISYSSSHIS